MGYILVHDCGKLTEEEAGEKLKVAFQRQKDSNAFHNVFFMSERFGVPLDITARAYWTQAHQWLLVNDTSTRQALDPEYGLAAAACYAESFGVSALFLGVYDSDASAVAYADPVSGVRKICLGGRVEGFMDDDDGADLRVEPPYFLLPALPEQTEESLHELWQREFTFEDDRLYELAEMLGVELFCYDDDRLSEKVTLLQVNFDQLT